MRGPTVGFLCVAVAGAALAASPAAIPPGCRLDDASTSQLRVYECQEKLRIAAEAATRLSAIQQNGRLVGLKVEGGAVLVERAGGPAPFQIVTAQAVTEAREGRVAVETTKAGTAVFVREGGATVSRDGGSVSLRSGEGVDVATSAAPSPAASAEPQRRPKPTSPPRSSPPSSSAPRPAPPPVAGLEVKTWGAKRAEGLMARLGQR